MEKVLQSMGFSSSITSAAIRSCNDLDACIEFCLNPPPEPILCPQTKEENTNFWAAGSSTGNSAPKKHAFVSKKKGKLNSTNTTRFESSKKMAAQALPSPAATEVVPPAAIRTASASPTKRARKVSNKGGPDVKSLSGPATVVLIRCVDLRLDDNQVISAAASRGGPVVLLFAYNFEEEARDGEWSLHKARAAKLW